MKRLDLAKAVSGSPLRPGRLASTATALAIAGVLLAASPARGDDLKLKRPAALSAAIIITQPRTGDRYPIGSRAALAWNAGSIAETSFNVILVNAKTKQRSGAFLVQNTGVHEGWLVSKQDTLGKYFFLFETFGGKTIARSGTFDAVPGFIAVTAPAAGQSLAVGVPFTIRWDAEILKKFGAGPVFLQVYSVATQKAGGGYPVSNTGAYDWAPGAPDLGQNKILISTGDDKFKGESGIFTIRQRLTPRAATKQKQQ